MRTYILFILVLHTATATIDLDTLQFLKENAVTNLQSLKENAAENLQALKETAAKNIEALQDTAATKLQTIQTKATESFQQFADTIDFDKVKQLDVLNILPKLQYKGKLIQDTVQSIPEYKQRVQFYLQMIKSLTGKDVILAFDAGVPWPAKRMDEEYAIKF